MPLSRPRAKPGSGCRYKELVKFRGGPGAGAHWHRVKFAPPAHIWRPFAAGTRWCLGRGTENGENWPKFALRPEPDPWNGLLSGTPAKGGPMPALFGTPRGAKVPRRLPLSGGPALSFLQGIIGGWKSRGKVVLELSRGVLRDESRSRIAYQTRGW